MKEVSIVVDGTGTTEGGGELVGVDEYVDVTD